MKNTSVILCLLLLAACKRPSDAISESRIEGTWFKTGEWAAGENLWCLYYYESCALDDAVRFSSDGRVELIDTGETCPQPPGPAGHWEWRESRLWLDGTGYEVIRCDDELWLAGERERNGFRQRHELRYRRA